MDDLDGVLPPELIHNQDLLDEDIPEAWKTNAL